MQAPCLNPQCMVPFTVAKFEIQLVAIVQAQVTTYKHFKGFHLHIEFSGAGGADACQSFLQMDVLLFFQIFSYLLATVHFHPTFNQTVHLGRVSPGVCQSIYSCNVKNVKGMWSSYYGSFKTKVMNCLTKMLNS
jgi:hypothetical protein